MENQTMTILNSLGITPDQLLQILLSLFVAILFTQSGIDKVMNWNGEKAFYKEHFSKTFLKNTIGLLMPVITLSELAAGILSSIGVIIILLSGNTEIAFLGMLMAVLSIIQLFFGQRVAKDYAGSATLVPYFLVTIAGLYVYLN